MIALAYVVAAVNLAAGLFGAWLWWRVEPGRQAFVALRVGQAAAAAQAVVGGVAAATGFEPDDGLFWLYALLPVAVSFVAEQLRIASAEQVLEQRGLPDAKAVGTRPDDQQRSVVRAILRRELGVLVAAAFVIAFLALRIPPTV